MAWLWLRKLMRGHAKVAPVHQTGTLIRFGAATWDERRTAFRDVIKVAAE